MEEELGVLKKSKKAITGKPLAKGKQLKCNENGPSPFGRRVEPRIDTELLKKRSEKISGSGDPAKRGRKVPILLLNEVWKLEYAVINWCLSS